VSTVAEIAFTSAASFANVANHISCLLDMERIGLPQGRPTHLGRRQSSTSNVTGYEQCRRFRKGSVFSNRSWPSQELQVQIFEMDLHGGVAAHAESLP
jgi:hypothetical protein